MSRYLLSVHMAAGQVREPMSEEDMRRGFEQIDGLEREMRAADALIFSGRLDEPGEARVVRPSNGRVRAIDGPYAETKEQLGGFYIIEAADLDAFLTPVSSALEPSPPHRSEQRERDRTDGRNRR